MNTIKTETIGNIPPKAFLNFCEELKGKISTQNNLLKKSFSIKTLHIKRISDRNGIPLFFMSLSCSADYANSSMHFLINELKYKAQKAARKYYENRIFFKIDKKSKNQILIGEAENKNIEMIPLHSETFNQMEHIKIVLNFNEETNILTITPIIDRQAIPDENTIKRIVLSSIEYGKKIFKETRKINYMLKANLKIPKEIFEDKEIKEALTYISEGDVFKSIEKAIEEKLSEIHQLLLIPIPIIVTWMGKDGGIYTDELFKDPKDKKGISSELNYISEGSFLKIVNIEKNIPSLLFSPAMLDNKSKKAAEHYSVKHCGAKK